MNQESEIKNKPRIKNQESRIKRKTIKDFTDLIVWKEGHALVLDIYLATKKYPKEEIFGLTSQTRRCVVSITSNVAEAFSRRSFKEKVQFFYTSLGSITELQNQLIIAVDVGYINKNKFTTLFDQGVKVQKIITGLIKGVRKKI